VLRWATGLLALLALLLVGAGGSRAASTSRTALASGEDAYFTVDPLGGEYPELDLSLSFGDGAPPARLVLYVPTGFQLYPNRPAGSPVGQAEAFAADGSYGIGGAALLAGAITAAENSATAAPGCGQGDRVALWDLQLSLVGQPLDVPIAISPAGPDAPPGAALKLKLCLPALPGANGALLPVNELRVSLDELETPTTRGSYVWHAFFTPVAPDRHTPLQERTYELRALLPLPHLLTLRGRYRAKSHDAVLQGRLTGTGQARPGVRVSFVRLVRRVTPRGVVYRDSDVGSVRTDAHGSFTFKTPLRKTAGFVAVVHDALARCSGASLAPAGCASTSITGTASEPITVSVPRPRKS
jgi:hypothetical protein